MFTDGRERLFLLDRLYNGGYIWFPHLMGVIHVDLSRVVDFKKWANAAQTHRQVYSGRKCPWGGTKGACKRIYQIVDYDLVDGRHIQLAGGSSAIVRLFKYVSMITTSLKSHTVDDLSLAWRCFFFAIQKVGLEHNTVS